jgi:predicted transcriptional regulator
LRDEERIAEMERLRSEGLSYREIGHRFGVTRARVHQLVSGYDKLRKSKKWQELRQAVMERDGHRCVCGATENLIVHHRNHDDNSNTMSNLITICQPCHASYHRLQYQAKILLGEEKPDSIEEFIKSNRTGSA